MIGFHSSKKMKGEALDKELLVDLGKGRYGLQASKYDDAILQRVGDILYVSVDEELLSAVANGNFRRGGNTVENMANLMPDNIFSAYVNMQQMQKISEDFEDLPCTELKTFANRKKAAFMLEMEDTRTNAWQQLFEIMNEAYLR